MSNYNKQRLNNVTQIYLHLLIQKLLWISSARPHKISAAATNRIATVQILSYCSKKTQLFLAHLRINLKAKWLMELFMWNPLLSNQPTPTGLSVTGELIEKHPELIQGIGKLNEFIVNARPMGLVQLCFRTTTNSDPSLHMLARLSLTLKDETVKQRLKHSKGRYNQTEIEEFNLVISVTQCFLFP